MIATLGMYDPPPLHRANNRFWQGIRQALGYGPDHLTRDIDGPDAWLAPDLLLAQTCGMPLRTQLHPHVTLVGTPDYGLPGCAPGYYHSVLVVRSGASDDLSDHAGGVFAYNDPVSQSGWAAPMGHLNQAGIRFAGLFNSGSHAASARAVADGRADLAGLDVLTWTLLGEHDPDLVARLAVIAATPPSPTLPFITATGRDPVPIAAAIRTAIANLSESDRAALHLRGLVDIPIADYLAVANPPGP